VISPIETIDGTGVAMPMNNVDTDQIMPKQFLKRVERSGFGEYIFHDRRAGGDLLLDAPAHAGASVLIAGDNFGCGSSREQAVWGLVEFGFAAIVAPSFAPIFRANAARGRLLTVELTSKEVRTLTQMVTDAPSTAIHIDIAAQRLAAGGIETAFELEQRTRDAFILGIDEIERTLARSRAIARYESHRDTWLPVTTRSAQL
jgi:3-isopropylmalate/(R)-2-methylmalate dehydratase small subunit